MLPDHLRWPVIALCLAALLWMGWRSTDFALHRDVGVRAALREPAAHDGATVLLMMWRVEEVRADQRWVAAKYTHRVEVVGPTEGLAAGQTVTATGTFHAAGADGAPEVRATWQEVHRWRRAKQALGLVGLLAALVALPLGFRVERGRLVERG